MNKNKLFITVSSLGLLLALVLMFLVTSTVDAGQNQQYEAVVVSVENEYILIKVVDDMGDLELAPNDLLAIERIGLPEPTGIETPTDRP